jgi:AAA15 family ATPase/GTPase
VPVAVIYGANASGKSNVVIALRWMRSAVLKSHSKGEPGGGVPRLPFALDDACASEPSTFELDFVVGGVRHHYGFEASDTEFLAEWLYAFPKAKRQMLFEREHQEFKFGRALEGRNRIISELTRPNSLFVSAAAQNDHKKLLEISSYFRSLRVYSGIAVGGEASVRLADAKVDARVIDFLGKIGTGVTGYRRTPFEIPEKLERDLREVVTILKKISNQPVEVNGIPVGKHVVLELAHRRRDGSDVFFELDRESAGTRRLLVLLGRVFAALDEGSPLVIDELDASLHTQACEAVLALFSSPRTNPKGAQLIATTHDTNLLSSPLLRRDQIWFTEKDPEGATHLYPLTDIRSRKGDNIERGYLQGRYGAVPFAGRLPEVLADS